MWVAYVLVVSLEFTRVTITALAGQCRPYSQLDAKQLDMTSSFSLSHSEGMRHRRMTNQLSDPPIMQGNMMYSGADPANHSRLFIKSYPGRC